MRGGGRTVEPDVRTIPEALAAVGSHRSSPSRRPVLRSPAGTLLTIAALGENAAPVWYGAWITPSDIRFLGPELPPSFLRQRLHLSGTTALLVDLFQASSGSYAEVLEDIANRFDRFQDQSESTHLGDLGALQRSLAKVRSHIVRLSVIALELEGPLGARFEGLAAALPTLRSEVGYLETLSSGLAQGVRDVVGIRNAVEANRLAEAANELGRTSNRIAALANTSNIRMLGVAYLALFFALVGAIVLFPNTAATILGMPSAAWVPGIWVDAVLIALAVIPIAVIFSRPWVRRMLSGLRSYEARSSEGLSDLTEVPEPSGPAGPPRETGPGPGNGF